MNISEKAEISGAAVEPPAVEPPAPAPEIVPELIDLPETLGYRIKNKLLGPPR